MNILARFVLMFGNIGMAAGLMLGGMLVLRPVLLRLLTAQQRSWLWTLVWYGTGMFYVFGMLGWFHFLPVTFRDLITPRTDGDTYDFPAYLPARYDGSGEYAVALPGGKAVWGIAWWRYACAGTCPPALSIPTGRRWTTAMCTT